MPIASGQSVQLVYIEETTRGTTPGTPSMTVIRSNGFNVNPVKNLLESSEVRSDRQVKDVRHGFQSVEGSIPVELSRTAHDDLFRFAMGGTWVAIAAQTDEIGVLGATVLCSNNTLITDGFRVGDIIELTLLTVSGDNGLYRVTVLTAGIMTLVTLAGVAASFTTEAEGPTPALALKGARLDIGSNLKTMTIERQFTDLTKYQAYLGVAVNTFELSITPEEIATATFGLIGMSSSAMSGTSLDATPTAAAQNDPLSSFDGKLSEGGTVIAVVTGLRLNLDNGRTLEPVVGVDTSPDVFEGTAKVDGEVTAFLQDEVLFNKFFNETDSTLWLHLLDPDDTTEFLNFVVPKVKYTGGTMDPPQEGPVPITMPFRALYDSVSGTSFSIQRSS